MEKAMKAAYLFIACLLVISACSISDKTKLADSAVSEFHDAFNAEQFEAIYEGAGKELKALAKRKEFLTLLKDIHSQLGQAGESKRVSWRVNYQTGGTTITTAYETKFTDGAAVEQFVFKVKDDKPLLVGYHIRVQERKDKPALTEA
jgi:hypothetical protein